MAVFEVENQDLRIRVNSHGAELVSLVRKEDGHEYMWSGDPVCWNRVSPVLFPFVGKCNGQTYRFSGKQYTGVPQHGYARDCEFEMVEQNADTIWFSLRADDEWKARYPFDFELRLGYRLEKCAVHVLWEVKNRSAEPMHFSIGGHPAFLTWDGEPKAGYAVDLHNGVQEMTCGEINGDGVLKNERRTLALDRGKLVLCEELFDKDAMIFDARDLHKATLCKPDGTPYLQVIFDVPQLGIWSPVGKKAPFVCIEPWYGRCDRADFTGDLSEREYANTIGVGEIFAKEYVIEVL